MITISARSANSGHESLRAPYHHAVPACYATTTQFLRRVARGHAGQRASIRDYH
jgi:hypothetical protein